MAKIRIETIVPDEIFEGDVIKSNLDNLLERKKEKIKNRVSQILHYIELEQIEEGLYEKIIPIFRERFCTKIANEVVKRAFLPHMSHNIYDGLLYSISESKVEEEINGNIILDIIQDILKEYLPEAERKEALRNSELCRNIREISIE